MRIILFRGRPGVGKTTLSQAFAAQTGYPILSKDSFYDSLAPFLSAHAERNRAAHECLYALLTHNLLSVHFFILDFPFQTPTDFEQLKGWCQAHQVMLHSILVSCFDERLWAERFNQRATNPAPNQLITDFTILKTHYSTLHIQPETGELQVDSAKPILTLLQQVTAFLSLP